MNLRCARTNSRNPVAAHPRPATTSAPAGTQWVSDKSNQIAVDRRDFVTILWGAPRGACCSRNQGGEVHAAAADAPRQGTRDKRRTRSLACRIRLQDAGLSAVDCKLRLSVEPKSACDWIGRGPVPSPMAGMKVKGRAALPSTTCGM